MKFIKTAFILALLSISSVSYAQLSCRDIKGLQDDLGDLADEIDTTAYFSNAEVDELENIVDLIYIVAYDEDNRKLIRAARRMDRAWGRADPDSYTAALDEVISELDKVYFRDCE